MIETPAAFALVSRPSSLRCAYCFDGLDLARLPAACPGCGTRVHDGCREGLAHCPTIGCPVAAAARRPGRGAERLNTVLSAAILGGSLVWLVGLLLGAVYALCSNANDHLAPELFLLLY